MLSVKLDGETISAARIPYVVDNNQKPIPSASTDLRAFFSLLDEYQRQYESMSIARRVLTYNAHSSRTYILSSLKYGFFPRIRDHGLGQLLPFMKWALDPRVILRYPFMLAPSDNLRTRMRQLETTMQEQGSA
jgi:hypothetical protein